MKRTLSFMVMAFALLLTQCRKPEVKFPTPSATEGVTVSMTVTAGPGSKTNIDADGRITWSSGDKLYVGDGSKCIGCLTLTSGADNPTGTFSGNVTLTKDTRGEQTFHFYYLGRAERTLENDGTSVEVSFAEQTGLRENLGSCHVGYGTANGTVTGNNVTDINVTLVSKVALARFRFKKGGTDYTDELTLSGNDIYNSMTVNFNSSTGFSFSGTEGDIVLSSGNAERYVMLVPVGTESETLSFAGEGFDGSTTLGSGIEPNKFYGRDGAIEVKPTPKFTVGMDGTTPRTVEFAPGNLWADATDAETPVFYFETNQWSFADTWNASYVSHFKWSDAAKAVTDDWDYKGDLLFCASNFTVTGDSHTWRTLTKDEWDYLLGYKKPVEPEKTDDYGRPGAKNLYEWKNLDSGAHKGLVILPDGTDNPSEVLGNITSVSDLATHGAVFLPAAGYRTGTDMMDVGSYGYYWSSTPDGLGAYDVDFSSDRVRTFGESRGRGRAVRLVR